MIINSVTERDLEDWEQLALELWADYADMQAIQSRTNHLLYQARIACHVSHFRY